MSYLLKIYPSHYSYLIYFSKRKNYFKGFFLFQEMSISFAHSDLLCWPKRYILRQQSWDIST